MFDLRIYLSRELNVTFSRSIRAILFHDQQWKINISAAGSVTVIVMPIALRRYLYIYSIFGKMKM